MNLRIGFAKWLSGAGLCGLLLGSLSFADGIRSGDLFPEKGFQVVDKGGGSLQLQMPYAVYKSPDGRTVELIGAVHLGEKQYYDKLNALFIDYDKVLFEMVGGEDMPRCAALLQRIENGEGLSSKEAAELQAIIDREKKKAGKYFLMGLIGPSYQAVADLLHMETQSDAIDYMDLETLVHADMSLEELQAAMDEKGESFLQFLLEDVFSESSEGKDAYEPDPVLMAVAFLKGDVRFLKGEMIKAMASEDDDAMKGSVILDGRNEKCIRVLDEVMADKDNKRIGVFYGAAHLPGLHKMLLERGYKPEKIEWMTAWDTDAKP